MGPKIATCCYCGTRAALKLSGHVQHELACASCGAPLHEIKQMPVQTQKADKKQHYDRPVTSYKTRKSKPNYKKKKRKGWAAELIDELEDVFDIFD